MQPNLFDWSSPCQVILFPMVRRIGRIRSTAEKMITKPTDRAAASYRDQVTDGLMKQMAKTGIPEAQQDDHLVAFWSAVQAEIIRLTYRNNRPGGHAA